jgi:hypothetical protein
MLCICLCNCVVCVYYCNVVSYHSLSMDKLIANVDDSNESSLDVNLNLMNITLDDDDGLVSLESPDGDVVQPVPSGESACAAEEVQEGDDPQKHCDDPFFKKIKNKKIHKWIFTVARLLVAQPT